MFDAAYPDARDNALRLDIPITRPRVGLFAGMGNAIAKAPQAGTLDVLSALSPVLDAYGKTAAFAEGASKESTINRLGDNEFGREVREDARRITPDPATTGTASQVLFGVGRVFTKAIPLAMAGGMPAAALGTGGVEGTVEAQNLMDEGVNPTTAAEVGGVKGVLTAAQIALPMSAGTKAGTAGLILAGGPGGFMAEQAASRWILQNADYTDIARRYNPLDPVGLAVSTIMAGGFGAVSHAARVRGEARATPNAGPLPDAGLPPGVEITPDMIAAARVHLAGEHVQGVGLYRDGDLAASIAHVNALESAARAIDAGERVEVGDIVRPEMVAPERAGQAADSYAKSVARAEVVESTRAELLAMAAGRAEPGVVRAIEAERPNVARALETLDASFRDRAKAFQEQGGMSRKQAESAARKEIDQVRADLEATLQRLDHQLESNRRAAQAEQDLAALDSGDLPARVQELVDQRIAEIQQGLQPKPMVSALMEAFPPAEVRTALAAEKVEATPENMAAVQLIARARQVDAEAVDALPANMPDAEYLARVQEIANAKQNDAATGAGGAKAGEQGSAPAGSQDGQGTGAAGREAGPDGAAGAAPKQVAGEAPDAVEAAARQAAEATPDAMVPDPQTGALVPAAQLLRDAEAAYRQQEIDSKAYEAAITCFLRH